MTGLNLIMAVSADGFMAKGVQDDMSWTGPTDKKLFRLLTYLGPVKTLGAGSTTTAQMPFLRNRPIVSLSRAPGKAQELTLEQFAATYPGAWLLGGPTVARKAFNKGLLHRVVLCRSKVALGDGIPDCITPLLEGSQEWEKLAEIDFGDVTVEVWF